MAAILLGHVGADLSTVVQGLAYALLYVRVVEPSRQAPKL
jgi:hypothetical protein